MTQTCFVVKDVDSGLYWQGHDFWSPTPGLALLFEFKTMAEMQALTRVVFTRRWTTEPVERVACA